MEKDHRPQSHPEENKADLNQGTNGDTIDHEAEVENDSLFHRLGEVNVMPDGMLSPVNETQYVNAIINENATEVDDEKRPKK